MKVYLVCAVWENTKNNHAGMFHLAKELKKRTPNETVLIAVPMFTFRGAFFIRRLITFLIACYLFFVVRKSDVVFLMEYYELTLQQGIIARFLHKKTNIVALAHFIPATLSRIYVTGQIQKWASYLSTLFVFGSSLKTYFVQQEVPANRVAVTYHYVDLEYYLFNERIAGSKEGLDVICMGNMERNYNQLLAIVKSSPEVHFHICMGVADLKSVFKELDNISLYGFMEEDKLRDLMRSCDISLNVMNDTIGSNVITTSLASGLAMIVSDVGSIRDYVNGQSGFFFTTGQEAVDYISLLNKDRKLLYMKQRAALKKAQEIGISDSCDWFRMFFEKRVSYREEDVENEYCK